MFYYLIVIVFCILFYYFGIFKNKYKIDNNYTMIFFIIFLFFSLFLFYMSVYRSLSVGTDTQSYYNYFWNKSYLILFETAIISIYKIIEHSNDFTYFFIICFVIVYGFSLFALKKNMYNFWISYSLFILSFLFFLSYNAVRQSMAISIIFFAMQFIIGNKTSNQSYIKYICLVYIATLFHVSAWIALVFVLLNKIKINKKVYLYSILFITFGYFTEYLKELIYPIISSIEFYNEKYSYNPDFFFEVNKEKGFIQFIPILIQYLFLILFVLKNFAEKLSKKELFVTNYYFIFLFLYSFSGIESIDRIQLYFIPSIIFFYDMLLFKQKNNSLLGISIIVFWVVYFTIRILQGTNGIYPFELRV
ncbi:EpsG family protein [Exiguobacterium sp. R-17]|uniref:EpsG family protein n=1 Tax=Exiguobacterium sp. R-17 TaxID=3404054 RepID=UPI003CF60E5A